jgi:hypothetical protein
MFLPNWLTEANPPQQSGIIPYENLVFDINDR